jgi:hypothetical protein
MGVRRLSFVECDVLYMSMHTPNQGTASLVLLSIILPALLVQVSRPSIRELIPKICFQITKELNIRIPRKHHSQFLPPLPISECIEGQEIVPSE